LRFGAAEKERMRGICIFKSKLAFLLLCVWMLLGAASAAKIHGW